MNLLVALAAGLVVSGNPAGAVLRGTVTTTDGKPLVGARVDIASAAPRDGQGLFCPSCYPDCKKGTITDAAGRFEIGGLDRTLKFNVLVSSPEKKARLSKLVDSARGPVEITVENLPAGIPAERILSGQVVDDRGKPIVGVLVDPSGARTADSRWRGLVRDVDPTASDEKGRFRLLLPAGYRGVDVTVVGKGYAGASFDLLEPGDKEHRLTIPAGTAVTGRLVRDGKPAAGVRIAVVQTERTAGHHFIKAVSAVTNEDGKFWFVHLPASESYVIFTVVGEGPQPFILTTKRFKAYADRQERDLGDLSLVPALRLAGRIQLPAGQTLPPESKIMLVRDPAWDLIAVPVAADGTFVIDGLPPETYEVRVMAKGFEIPDGGVSYQMLHDNAFGIHLRQSIEDLQIPLTKVAPPSAKQ